MTPGIDLNTLAREAMRAKGFDPDFPAAVLAQAEAFSPHPDPRTRDLRSLLWSSIDNDSSKDLDQVEYAEPAPNGRIRIMIGIADVDAAAPKSTPIDVRAADQTVSVYTHARVFPMIPDSDLILPFIAMRRRADGSVMVSAPAFTGGSGPFGARAKMMGLPDKSDGPQSLAQGRFTIVTDGEILTNNSEDGPEPHAGGRQLKWNVDATSTKVPEALVKL